MAAAPEGERQTEQKPAAPENGIGQQQIPARRNGRARRDAGGDQRFHIRRIYRHRKSQRSYFCSESALAMVLAIVPSEGRIYAPCDAAVEMVMDTKHAVGLRTSAGNGLLIHVGIDTVNLEGKYFDVHVSEGQSLKKGRSDSGF